MIWIGAVGSLGFTLYAGRHNPSIVLMLLFGLWVLSPFAMLMILKHRAPRYLGAAITLASLAIYGYVALGHPIGHTATAFLVVPLVSWLLIAVACVLRKRAPRP
ncbi:MAG: hypothetical protein ABJC09_02870 [Terriglobia bacterium]